MPLTQKQQRTLDLAKKGGKDSELLLLDFIFELEDKLEELTHSTNEKIKEAVAEIKTGIPDFLELIQSIRLLAEKETPAPVINIPETKVEVKAPIVNIPKQEDVNVTVKII